MARLSLEEAHRLAATALERAGASAGMAASTARALVLGPGALAGSREYLDRVEVLVREMLVDEGVRLPGARRERLRQRAHAEGVEVPDALLAQLKAS